MSTQNSAPAFIQAEALAALLTSAAGRVDVHVLPECDSTNLQLLQMAKAGAPSGTLLLAERQTAGRGRRGRSWFQGQNSLAFSLLWRLPEQRSASGLSLAVGVALAEALDPQTQLKWPNDVLLDGRKVAGILIESAGPQCFVIGIGINLGAMDDLPQELTAQATGITTHLSPVAALAKVLDALIAALDLFAAQGFIALQTRWQQRHAYQDLAVNLFFSEGSEPVQGVCRGVDQNGELLLETATCLQTISSGEVSLRLQ
ncbi:MAG TPA: biotin--[acetyl-CoA-carboxylase] ligase [Rhodocyclaceae bacterium]|nr:biotin--[acetyl-CoA-carboxylase] ligase [Rhodocyclaceae bacterium]